MKRLINYYSTQVCTPDYSMLKKTEITEDDFRRLMLMFAHDDESAAREYENIRRGLIRYFRFRGCEHEEELADETINRVAVKTATVEFDGRVKLITYFLSFASRIHMEYLKEQRRTIEKWNDIRNEYLRAMPETRDDDGRLACLEKCLGARRSDDRELLLGYYAGDKNAEHRRSLASRHGISVINLHTRASRLRSRVADCVKGCLGQN